jgi:hypothetical protein
MITGVAAPEGLSQKTYEMAHNHPLRVYGGCVFVAGKRLRHHVFLVPQPTLF